MIANVFENDSAQFSLKNFQSNANIAYEIVCKILEMGPCQPLPTELPGGKYPVINGHRFSPKLYHRILSDGTVTRRNWLSYSKSTERLYCIEYILFPGKGKNAPNKAWVIDGYENWSTCTNKIENHEKTSAHIYSSLTLKIRQSSLPLIPSIATKKNEEVFMNREIIKELIDITLFLGRHNIAFRGHRENWQNNMCGNFKDLCSLILKFSPAMATYFSSQKQKYKIKQRFQYSFTSWRRQNALIDIVSNHIKSSISLTIKNSKFFSIAIDSTFNVSHREQISFVFRYVDEEKCEIKERLLALKDTPKTTGNALCEIFKEVCELNSLDWTNNLVGQFYDGASNMRGRYNGLQQLIRNENPQAIFIWCFSHRLNLIVADAVSVCSNAMDLFGNLERLYDFISSSKFCADVYEEQQKKHYHGQQIRRLKRVSCIRWMSHKFALDVVLNTYVAIVECLNVIRSESGDKKAGSEAGGFLNYFKSTRFVYTAYSFKVLLQILEPVSSLLQKTDFDLLAASFLKKKNMRKLFHIDQRNHSKLFWLNLKHLWIQCKILNFNHFQKEMLEKEK